MHTRPFFKSPEFFDYFSWILKVARGGGGAEKSKGSSAYATTF